MSEVEWDRLADYAGGALDGPDAAYVARLVHTDPAWMRAYAELTAADRLVASELARLGTAEVRLPAEVAARLDEALAGQRGDTARPELNPSGAATVTQLADARRQRRRWARVAGIAAVAAGVVAFGAFVLPGLDIVEGVPTTSSDRQSSGRLSDRQDAAQAEAPGAGTPGGAPPMTLASGRDYQRAALSDTAPGLALAQPLSTTEHRSPALRAPTELARLTGPVELRECLNAVTAQYGGRAVTVDFARFEGAAALVIRVTEPDQVVVAGPSCGLPGMGADIRYQATAN